MQPGEAAIGGIQHECRRQSESDDRPNDPGIGLGGNDPGGREHQCSRGHGQKIGPDDRGPKPICQPFCQRKRPVFPERLIGQPPRQLFVGFAQCLRPVEAPEHGRFWRPAPPQAAPQPAPVVETIGPQHGLVGARRAAHEHQASRRPFAGQLAERPILFFARVHDHRPPGSSQVGGQVDQVTEHALAQHDLAGQQPARPSWSGIDDEPNRLSSHQTPPCAPRYH